MREHPLQAELLLSARQFGGRGQNEEKPNMENTLPLPPAGALMDSLPKKAL